MRVSARAVIIKDSQLLVMDRNKFGFHYLSIPGGALEPGEQPEQAAEREVLEETSIVATNFKLIIIEDAGDVYGLQHIYRADYVSGQPRLDPKAIESKITAGGKNIYKPKWLPVVELADSDMLPKELKDLLVKLIRDGFPDQPIELTIPGTSKL